MSVHLPAACMGVNCLPCLFISTFDDRFCSVLSLVLYRSYIQTHHHSLYIIWYHYWIFIAIFVFSFFFFFAANALVRMVMMNEVQLHHHHQLRHWHIMSWYHVCSLVFIGDERRGIYRRLAHWWCHDRNSVIIHLHCQTRNTNTHYTNTNSDGNGNGTWAIMAVVAMAKATQYHTRASNHDHH